MSDKKVKASLDLDASGVKKGAKEAEDAIKKVKDEFDELGDSGAKGSKKASEGIKELNQGLDKAQQLGKNLTKYLTLPIVGFGTMAVNTTKDFKYSMAEVSAISGATGSDLEKLEEQAKELGRTTFFSATEASQGMKYYAMAGFEVNEIMSAMPATLDLAIASNTDLARTCDIVSDAMTALKIPIEDTSKFTDILAMASSKANTNVEMLGESFKYCAPVAGELGIKAEDLAVGLGLMANAGVKGSMSGTQMRTALSRLVKPTKEMKATMEKYNIAIQTNSDGTVDLMATMKHLRKQLGELEATEKANVIATLMGQEAMAGWSAIIGASEEDFNDLTEAIYNSEGATKKMSETMSNTFEGKLRNMKSAFEGVQIAVGEILIPTLEKLVDKITGVFTWFNELDSGTQKFLITAGGAVAVIGPLMIAIGGIGKMALGAFSTIKTLAGGLGLTLSAGTALTAGLVALGVAFSGLLAYMGSSSEMISWLQTEFGAFGTFCSYLGEFLYGTFQLTFGNIGILIKTLGKMLMALMKGDFKEVGSIWKDGWAEMEANTAKAGSNMAMETAKATKKIREMSTPELEALQNQFDTTMGNLKGVTADNIKETAKVFAEQLEGMDNEAISLLSGTSDTMAMLFNNITENMTEKQAMNVFTSNLEAMVRSGELTLESLESSTKEFNNMIELNMSTGANQLGSAGKALFENFKNEATRGIEETATNIVADLQKMDADTFATLQGCGETWGQIFSDIALDGSMTTEDMKNKIMENFNALGISGSQAMELLKTELNTSLQGMNESADANLSQLPTEVAEAVNGMVTEAGGASAVKDTIANATSGTSSAIASGVDGTSEAVGKEVSDAINEAGKSSQITDKLASGTSGATGAVDKNLSGVSTAIDKNTSNMSKEADKNFQKIKKSADTNTKAMATSVKTNATNMYNGSKTSFSKMAESASTSTANMKNNVINNCAIMKNSAIRFWEEIRSTYAKTITGKIEVTRNITEKVNKIVTVETEQAGSESLAYALSTANTIDLAEKNSALKSLAIIKSADRMEAEKDKKKDDNSYNKPVNETKNITYNYSYTSPKESSISELRRKDRIQAQRIALSRK